MIIIKNLKKDYPIEPWDIRVDRKGPYGNPFRMVMESQRDEVCDKYQKHFNSRIENDSLFKRQLMSLVDTYLTFGKLNLFCWCSPARCHAETIREWILSVAEERRRSTFTIVETSEGERVISAGLDKEHAEKVIQQLKELFPQRNYEVKAP